MKPECLAIFEQEGCPRDLTGNTPLLLDDPESVWLVRSGRVDLFAVPLEQGQPAGARTHLFRAEAGQILLGVDLGRSPVPIGFLAVGSAGSQVCHLPRARLRELAQDPAVAGLVSQLLDAWIHGLTAGVIRGPTPKACGGLEPGQEIHLEAHGQVGLVRDPVWIRHVQGETRFLGRKELSLNGQDGYWPIARPGWVEAHGPVLLSAQSTQGLLADAALWSSLPRFHQVVLACMAENARETAQAERERLQQRAATDRRLHHTALAQLAAVVTLGLAEETGAGDAPDALLAACQLVGRSLQVPVQPPPGTWTTRNRSTLLQAIARASRIRTRRVVLAEDWWRHDNGPLLAFLAENERPVALLPTSASSYVLVDPLEPARTPVIPAVAAKLGQGFAISMV